ncbi:MAG: NAD(+)/NADH kinase [Hyphomonadaceae bacterium]|nr:NAD(+)/NADH kinase [Hyphomonadaceae bacterium]MBX3510171.1 NAD(+)/NADH kinase [Hyphomonadaceae bacterium]
MSSQLAAAPEASPKPARFRTALVFFNPKAGSVSPGDGERLSAALTESGVERYAIVGADKITRRLFARADQFDVIIVLGGDGTARCAAALAPADGPPLLLLPGGTLNILPKALLGDLAWPEALAAALSHGVVRRLPAGRANGERFFVAAMFGAPTVLARAREAMREGRVLQAFGRFRHFLRRAFTRGLRARHDQERLRKAEAIGVLLPAFSGRTEGEGLEWVRLTAAHFIDLARVSVRALGDGWRTDPAVEVSPCFTGDIGSSGVIPATLDGEPRTFFSRVRITYDRIGVRVLALNTE